MIRVACPKCQTKYRFNASQLHGRARARARCQKCGEAIEITAAEASSGTAASVSADAAASELDTTTRVRRMRSDSDEEVGVGEQTMTAEQAAEALELPADKKYSLAVLRGNASGQIFNVSKPRTTIGRSSCDVTLDDPECSRQHAVLEILGSRTTLSDLGSTNGTFVEGRRIDKVDLENQSEFRVGEHVFMLIITDRE